MTNRPKTSAMIPAAGTPGANRHTCDEPDELGTGGERLARPVGQGDHALGPEEAPVTLVVYGDYLCPRTRQAWPVIAELLEELGDRLRVVFRHFPTTGDPPDQRAAEAASAQGKFWKIHEVLLRTSEVMEGPFDRPLPARCAATKADLDRYEFERQVARRVHVGKVSKT